MWDSCHSRRVGSRPPSVVSISHNERPLTPNPVLRVPPSYTTLYKSEFCYSACKLQAI